MRIIVGLGNPGEKFKKTRHNIGFRSIDCFYEKVKSLCYFSDFENKEKFQSLISEGEINKQKIILIKPQTFMNSSGKAIKKLIDFYKVETLKVIVIHDDIDLPLGKIKINKNRGSAGHKGIESIIKELKTKNFIRIRIGIAPEKEAIKTEDFVLKKFNQKEEEILKKVLQRTITAIELILKEGLEKTMNLFNRKEQWNQ